MPDKKKERNTGSYQWLAIMLMLTFILGLAKVWVTVERVDLAYRMERLQGEYRDNRELRTKLTIERNNLMSPYRLREFGQQHGLFKPGDEQIRKITK
ncbi:hypothetical protein [Desulfonatronospira sp.]|uniref:hypothetical protein n=1 Tax=Desulfonatronospira sp. TaxID=1962951 RepID=UPI0025C71E6D|nr:hypothetical protein [Desulfonatronospira sp.]